MWIRLTAIALCCAMIMLMACGCDQGTARFGNLAYQFPYPEGERTVAEIPEGIGGNAFLSGLNFVDDTTPVQPVEHVSSEKRTPGEPYAVEVKYDDGTGVCVAIYDVAEDFGACRDGTEDATPAIQRALLQASKQGGGVVYIPEGIYLCENTLEIPSGVTLRGEWVSPDTAPAGSCGTLLLVRSPSRGRESGGAFIKLRPGAGLRNVTILYPEQTADDIAKYPATIQEMGGDSFTVMNTTIAGCWNGYQGNLNWSELHYLKNVYISAFNNAIMLDNVTDIGRLEGVRLAPDYLVENDYSRFGEEDKQILRNYMFEHSVGLWMQRSDWEYVYDLEVRGLSCAIRQVRNSEKRAANAQYCKLSIIDCDIGIDIQATNDIGCAFTDIDITGSADCGYGVLLNTGFTATCEFQNLRVSGPIGEQFAIFGSGHCTIVNSRFADWGEGTYALNLQRGGTSVQQTEFAGSAGHIDISSKCGGVSVLGCTFGGAADIRYDAGKESYVKIDHTPLDLPVTSGRLHVYRRTIPTTASDAVYNVADFGAEDGADSTKAFQNALEAAAKTGGVVYVPAGEYRLSQPLTVPSGVELRGIYNVPTHSAAMGSVITTTLGKGDADGEPLISLEAGSGVNGLSFYYPEQSFTDFIPYPWTVRSLGENCWAINTVFINSYQALDFGTNPSAGHYISYCSGAALSKGVFVGNNDGNGWMENCQFNPHYWKRAAVLANVPAGAEQLNNAINETLAVFIAGDNKSEHMLGNFAYGGRDLLTLISQGKGGLNGTVIGHGSDGCQNALVVEEADVVEFINAELVSMNGQGEMRHIVMEKSVTGTVALFNTMMWAQPTPDSIHVEGGRLVINQMSYLNMEKTANLVDASGGEVWYCTAMMLPKTYQVKASGNAKVHLVGNVALRSLSFIAPSGEVRVTVLNEGASVEEIGTWWS